MALECGTPGCRDFKKGKCKRGSTCHFFHSVSSNLTVGSGPGCGPDRGAVSVAGSSKSIEPCKQFLRGKCKNGSNCKYLHVSFRPSTTSAASDPAVTPLASAVSRSKAVAPASQRQGGKGRVEQSGGSQTLSNVSSTVCKLCGQKVYPFLRCCKGDVCVIKRDPPSKKLVTHCLESCRKWAVSTELGDKVTRGGQRLLSYSQRSQDIERELVALFRGVNAAHFRELGLPGHCTRPWAAHASDMTDAKSMTELFSLSSDRMRFSSTDMKAAVGGVLHGLLDQACARICASSSSGTSAVALSTGWAEAASQFVTIDEAGLNIRVSGTSDAMYHGVPVELKTISSKKGGALGFGKVGKWLNQLAVYQCGRPDRAALLVVICRDTCALKAFEVSPANVDRAERFWRGILRPDPMLCECFALSGPYMEALRQSKAELPHAAAIAATGKAAERNLFPGVLAKARDLLRRHAMRLLGACAEALNVALSGDCMQACRCFMRARRCVTLLVSKSRDESARWKNKKTKGADKDKEKSATSSGSLIFPKWEQGLQQLYESVRSRLLVRAAECERIADSYLETAAVDTCPLDQLLVNALALYAVVLGDKDSLTVALRDKRKAAKEQGLIRGGAVGAMVAEFDDEAELELEEGCDSESAAEDNGSGSAADTDGDSDDNELEGDDDEIELGAIDCDFAPVVA